MAEELNQAISEFEPKKKDIEDMLINKLINYVRNGSLSVEKNAVNTCYDIIYSFTTRLGKYLLNYHNEKIKEIVNECYEKIKDFKDLVFIDSFISYTERLNYLFYYMSRIFLYISSNYLMGTIDDNSRLYDQDDISEFSMDIYKEFFFNKLIDKLYNILNEFLIKEERNGKTEYRQRIQKVMKIISNMDIIKPKIIKLNENNSFGWEEKIKDINNPLIYQRRWFELYKKMTGEYLHEKYKNDIEKYSIQEYLNIEIKFINEEIERQNNYINKIFHEDLNDKLFFYLINFFYIKKKKEIMTMIKKKNISDINLVFQLSKFHPNGIKLFEDEIVRYLIYRFSLLNKDYKLAIKFEKLIPALIELIKEIDKFILLYFDKDSIESIKEKIRLNLTNIMKDKRIFAYSLSDYIDYCMTELFKDKSQEEIEQILNDIIFIFNIINIKLIFKDEFEMKLSQRLLNNLSISLEYEKLFISKLKNIIGATYTSEMISMINDYEESKKYINEYKISLNNKGNTSGIDFNATVIYFNSWDSKRSYILKIEIPKFLQFYMDDFENYYLNKYNSVPRKLNWLLGLSRLNIEYLYLKNKNISISSLPQLLILLCLEKHNKLSLEKIAEILKCDMKIIIDEVKRLIYNPNFNPNKEINKGVILPNKNEMDNTTEISINKDFNISQEIFITLYEYKRTYKITSREKKEIIERYHNNAIQATITRIMKSRIGKQVTELWIINEVMKEIDLFKAQEGEIKKGIQRLVEFNIIRKVGNLFEYNP